MRVIHIRFPKKKGDIHSWTKNLSIIFGVNLRISLLVQWDKFSNGMMFSLEKKNEFLISPQIKENFLIHDCTDRWLNVAKFFSMSLASLTVFNRKTYFLRIIEYIFLLDTRYWIRLQFPTTVLHTRYKFSYYILGTRYRIRYKSHRGKMLQPLITRLYYRELQSKFRLK